MGTNSPTGGVRMTPQRHVLGIFVGAGGYTRCCTDRRRRAAHKAHNAGIGADQGRSVTGLLP